MEWPLVRLEQLAAQQSSSIKIGLFGSQLKKTELVASGIHVVGIENVISNMFDELGDRYITEEKFSTLRSFEIKPGDVLMTMMGTIGEVTVVPQGTSTSIMDSHLLRFRPNPKLCSSEYVAWLLKGSASTRSVLHGRAHGAIMKGLNSGIVRSLPAPIPPLSEQRRIVEILDQADALRKRRAEADDKAERILPSLFNKMFGDPATNPKSWEIMKLSDLVVELRYGTSTRCSAEPNGLPVLRIPNILRGEVDLGDLKYAELPAQEANRLLLQYGDLLFVRTNGNRNYVGRCAIFGIDAPYLFASYLIRSRLQQDRVDPWYVGAYLRTPSGRQAMSSFIRTTAGQSNISLEGLRQIPIPLPPLTTQRLFRTHTEHLYWLRQEREKSGNSLETTFSSLLHRAFSGDLTAKWRETHMKELLAEMEEQAKHLAARGTHSQLENAALQESLF